MITVDVQQKTFGAECILQGIALTVSPGECLAVLGTSGVGKSTLLRIAAGLDTNFTGQVHCPAEKAMVFQEPTLLPWRTVMQNLSLFHPNVPQGHLRDMLHRVGLDHRADLYPTQLSLGQQRRLALARAFAGHPKALFLDEPFVSLDPETAADMIALTESLLADMQPATIFVTHSQAEADRLASKRVTLSGIPATTGGNGK